MHAYRRPTRLIALCALVALSSGLSAVAQQAAPSHRPLKDTPAQGGPIKALPTDSALIASAMRAAPDSVSREATIVVPNKDGSLRTLRKGSNDYTCLPDNPASPGRDSMCMDRNGLAWLKACMAGKAPPAGRLGLMYMLEGGSDASNVDPTIAKPPPGQPWISTGPHIMLVGADQMFYSNYPTGAKPDTTVPYVMWAGTPCEHLMAPTM